MSVINIVEHQGPEGELATQTMAMPTDTNPYGDIFAGWLVSQMDLAGAVAARKICGRRVATVAMDGMQFLGPVHVGAIVSCYTQVLEIGGSSIRVRIEVWVYHNERAQQTKKITEGEFVYVAVDKRGRTRNIEKSVEE